MMFNSTLFVCGATLALAIVASPGHCQGQTPAPSQMVQPEPLESSHPRAQQATALVHLILKGDREGALKLLRSEGTAAFVKSAEFEGAVDAQIARLSNKGYAITELMTGRGADVVVELTSATEEPTNIVIRLTTEAPHRIEGFARAMMG